MEKLMNSDIDNYRLRVNGARAEVHSLVCAYERSTGDVREAYKKVINDKLWKFSKMNGEFYHLTMDAVITLQKTLEATLGGEYQKETIEAMATSYTASAPPVSVPSA